MNIVLLQWLGLPPRLAPSRLGPWRPRTAAGSALVSRNHTASSPNPTGRPLRVFWIGGVSADNSKITAICGVRPRSIIVMGSTREAPRRGEAGPRQRLRGIAGQAQRGTRAKCQAIGNQKDRGGVPVGAADRARPYIDVLPQYRGPALHYNTTRSCTVHIVHAMIGKSACDRVVGRWRDGSW